MFKTDASQRPLIAPETDTVEDAAALVVKAADGASATVDLPAHGIYTVAPRPPVTNGGRPEQWESATRRAHRLRMKEYFSRAYRPL